VAACVPSELSTTLAPRQSLQWVLLLTISVVKLKDRAPQALLQLVLREALGAAPVAPLGGQPPTHQRHDT
jgi:hypothetical protein